MRKPVFRDRRKCRECRKLFYQHALRDGHARCADGHYFIPLVRQLRASRSFGDKEIALGKTILERGLRGQLTDDDLRIFARKREYGGLLDKFVSMSRRIESQKRKRASSSAEVL